MARRRRRVWRYSDEFRLRAIQRVMNGESVTAVAQELDLHKRLLRAWVCTARRAQGAPRPKPPVSRPKQPDQLLRENERLKRALADKTLEVDFFKGALQKIAARRQARGKTGETASTPKSGN